MATTVEQLELPSLLVPVPAGRSRSIFVSALLAATLLHILLLLTLSFVPPAPAPDPETTLEVVILSETGQTTSHASPDAALSQRDRAGESIKGDATISDYGDATERTEADVAHDEGLGEQSMAEPVPLLHSSVAEQPSASPQVTTSLIPAVKTDSVLSATTESATDPVPASEALSAMDTRIDAAHILASRGREIARLTANLEARSDAYAKRVRRKSVSASTREFRYASYLGAWARKVERIGNINYPQAAKDQRIYGSLILHVAVRADGSVEHIRVAKSSGYDLLDEAAIQIVELAAPFSPFPPDIAAETDVLDIIRTWQFMRGNVLGWER